MNRQQRFAKTDKRKEWLIQYREKNREKINAYQTEWAKANPDKIKTKAAKHLKNNPKQNAAKSQRRRARVRESKIFLVTKKETLKLYSQPCISCGSIQNQTIDHIIPISRGGSHSVGNLQTLCRSCNCSKKDKTMMEWRTNKVKA